MATKNAKSAAISALLALAGGAGLLSMAGCGSEKSEATVSVSEAASTTEAASAPEKAEVAKEAAAEVATPAAQADQEDASPEPQTQQREVRERPRRLAIGVEAPGLPGVTWHDGDESLGTFEKGKVYVLDFWATWCGPCIRAMPHMKDIQDRHADDDLHVVAVHIFPRPGGQTPAQFLESRGGSIGYAVAEDTDRSIERTYMGALGLNGIPTVMIIDREGRLVWHGHPMNSDEVIQQVVDGEYDIDEVIAKNELREKEAQLERQVRQALNNEEWDKALSTLDELIALDGPRAAFFARERERLGSEIEAYIARQQAIEERNE